MFYEQKEYPKYDVVIIDINNLFTRSYCAITMSTDDGIDIGGVCGTLNTISSVISKFDPKCVIAVYDGKGGSDKKRQLSGAYKEGRKVPKKSNLPSTSEEEQVENFTYQIKKVYSYLSILPIIQFAIEGLEADDVIAYIATKRFKDDMKLIVSADKDFYQLVDEKTHIYPLSANKDLITPEKVIETFGSLGNGAAIVKAIIGDKSDNIKSVTRKKLEEDKRTKGIGIKTLIKIFPTTLQNPDIDLEQFINICKTVSTDDVKYKSLKPAIRKHYTTLAEAEDILRTNYMLVQLRDVNMNINKSSEILEYLDNVSTDDLCFDNIILRKKLKQDMIPVDHNTLQRWRTNFLRLKNNTIRFIGK